MKNNESGERSRWKAEWLKEGGDEMTESLTTIVQQSWGRKTGAFTIERDINRVTIKRRWIKRKKIIDDNLKLKEKKWHSWRWKKAILKVNNNESGDRSRWKAEWLKERGDEIIESLIKMLNIVEEEKQMPLQHRETSMESL